MSQGPYDPNAQAGPPPGPEGQPQQPGYYPPGYGQQPPGYPPQGAYGEPSKTPGLAIAGLILAFVFWPVGLILSIIALVKSKERGGKGLAIGGVIVSVLALLGTILLVVALSSAGGMLSGPTDAVTTMNESLIDGDCDAFVSVTTESFRSGIGLTGCDNWEGLQTAWVGGMTEYTTRVTSVNIENATARVETTETYLLHGSPETADFSYELVLQSGGWKVDAVS